MWKLHLQQLPTNGLVCACLRHQDNVELHILTKPFAGGKDFKRYMHNWARKAFHAAPRSNDAASSLEHGPVAASAQLQHGQQPQGQEQQGEELRQKRGHQGLPTPLLDPLPEFEPFNASAFPRLYVIHHHVSDSDIPR